MNKQEALEGINDKLKDLKYYAKEMGEVLKSTNYFIDELEKQVKEVEQKPKAYHVTDKYSYDCLIKELVEKGYTKTLGGFLTIKTSYYSPVKEKTRNYIYLHDNDNISFSHELVRDGYDLIEYYKEQPKYLLQTDLTSENGIQYLSFDKKRRKYFMGALMTSENVQQRFTDDEISKIKLTTRFAKLCEKVEVE